MRRVWANRWDAGLILLTALAMACGSASVRSQTVELRYLVTERAIDTERGSIGLCVAFDPLHRQTVWWWQPGGAGSGCATRSTDSRDARAYPGVLEYPANVSQSRDGALLVSFRLGTHDQREPFREIRLEVERDKVRLTGTEAWIPLQRRADLNLPLEPRRQAG